MIIQRDTVGKIRKTTTGRYYFQTEFEDGTTIRPPEQEWWPASTSSRLKREQKRKPVGLLNLDDLSWWMYKGKIYVTKGHPRPTEVRDFLDTRVVLAEFLGEPVFPKDGAFGFKTAGKRKPPGVPSAEIVRPARGRRPAPEKRRKQGVAKPRREYIPDRVKIFVWKRDGGRCVNCGSRERLEFDHIIPVSKGGSNTARNLQLLCERCNRSKGSLVG